MTYDSFLAALSEPDIVAAIRETEMMTSGEVRVFVCHLPTADPMSAAWARFAQLGMNRTAERNGALVFLAPESQNFAIIGDEGIHSRCGADFWLTAAAALSKGFRDGAYTQALCQALRSLGHELSHHFPVSADDRNELPNEVVKGRTSP